MALSEYEKRRLLALLVEEDTDTRLLSSTIVEVVQEILLEIAKEIARNLFENLFDWFFS